MFLLSRGVRETASVNVVMVAVKLAILAFFIVVAFAAAFNADNLKPFAPDGSDGVVSAASVIFFAYIGFDAVSTGAEEAKEPKRDLPIAIIGSLVICTVIYILVSIAAVGSLDATTLQESDAPLAAVLDEGAGHRWAASLLAFGALVAITSVHGDRVLRPDAHLLRDGARRPDAARAREGQPAHRHAGQADVRHGHR